MRRLERRRHGGVAALTALVPLALVLTGCAGDDREPAVEAQPGSSPAVDGSSAPDPALDPTAALRGRCLSAIPEEAELEAFTLAGATGGDLEAARITPPPGSPASTTVAVLLPQTGGMCGWGRWATLAAQEAGITSVLVNPCGYGESTCSREEDADPLNEVAAAVELARDELGATKVALLGTSMGGSLTVIAVAEGADVDAWADVSGPPAWDGVDLADLAPRLPGNGVVMYARSDGMQAFRAAKELAGAAGVPFVEGGYGHGWELLVDPVEGTLTRLGRRLITLSTGAPGR